MWIITSIVQVLVIITGVLSEDHFKVEEDLHHDLLEHYSHTSRPVTNPSHQIVVELTPSDFRIEEVDDYGNTLTSAFMMSMSWYDIRLRWNRTAYGGIDNTRIAVDRLWLPDISGYNLIPRSDHIHHGRSAMVYSTGKVTTYGHVAVTTYCNLDLTYYPFDSHICKIVIGSWTFHGDQIGLKFPYGPEVSSNMDDSVQHPNWESTVGKVTANITIKKYPCCPETYPTLVITVPVKRKPNLNRYLIIAPSVVFACLVPVLFLLPSSSKMKCNFGLLLIVAITMMFVILENSVSFQHSTIPRLAIFYLVVLIMAAISITLSAIILTMLERGSKGRPLPAWLKKITFGRYGIRRLMCMENMTGDKTYSFLSMKQLEDNQDIYSQPLGTEMKSAATTSDVYLGDISKATRIMAGKVIAEDTIKRNSEEWVEFARVIDNVLFVVFVFVLVIVFASFGFK